MDLVDQRRRAAHVQCAAVHDDSAEFQSALSAFFQSLGDDLQAVCARRLAEDHRERASQERAYARATIRATGGIAA